MNICSECGYWEDHSGSTGVKCPNCEEGIMEDKS